MQRASFAPRAQIFVCTNERSPDDPLQSACGRAGPPLFTALKRRVQAAGQTASLWITRTGCQGYCPRHGCSVTIEPAHEHFTDAIEHDADALFARADPTTRQR